MCNTDAAIYFYKTAYIPLIQNGLGSSLYSMR